MARADAANACVQSDSIKGLAQSIAKPAYHRLLIAEPALRRAVPTLIIAFLITICLGAFVQVVDQTRQKRLVIQNDISMLAELLAERIDRLTSVARGAAEEHREPADVAVRHDPVPGQSLGPPRRRHLGRHRTPRPRPHSDRQRSLGQ